MGISESIQSISNAIFPVIATAIYGFIGYNIYFFLALIPLAGSFVTMRLIKKLRANDN